MRWKSSLAALFLVIGAQVGSAATITFNFNSDAGKSTTFTDTVSGLSATFSSLSDPGGFTVIPTFFKALTGNVLLDPGPANKDNLALTITFGQDLSSLSLLFATNSGAGVPLVLTALEGSTVVGTASSSGVIPSGFFFPEGTLTFSGATFNKVALSSTALDFAIDDVTVVGTAVPEPAMFLPGCVIVAGLAMRLYVRRIYRGRPHTGNLRQLA
jgi:hypothetical protein